MSEPSDVQPLEGDNVLAVAAGTAIWLIIGLALLPFHRRLDEQGHLWWIATAFTGFGLGCLGLVVTVRKRRRDRARR